jgi:hypothetical protein
MAHWRSRATFLLSAALLLAVPGAAPAQTYGESFDGPLISVMLGGGLEFGADGDWSVRVDDGALELENRSAESALRYYHVDRIT